MCFSPLGKPQKKVLLLMARRLRGGGAIKEKKIWNFSKVWCHLKIKNILH